MFKRGQTKNGVALKRENQRVEEKVGAHAGGTQRKGCIFSARIKEKKGGESQRVHTKKVALKRENQRREEGVGFKAGEQNEKDGVAAQNQEKRGKGGFALGAHKERVALEREIKRKEERAVVACWRHSNEGLGLQRENKRKEEKVWIHAVVYKKGCSCSERIIEKKGGGHSVGAHK